MLNSILCTLFSVACTISNIFCYVFGGSAPDTVSGVIVWLLPIAIPSMYSTLFLSYTNSLSPKELKKWPDKIYVLHSISQIFCALTTSFVTSLLAWATVTMLFSLLNPLGGKEDSDPEFVAWGWIFIVILAYIICYIVVVGVSWIPYIGRAARYSNKWVALRVWVSFCAVSEC